MEGAAQSGIHEERLSSSSILLQLAFIPAVVIGLAAWPLLTFAALSGLAWFVLRGRRDPRWARIFWAAAALGTIGEAICVCVPWSGDGVGLWIYRFPSPPGLSFRLPIWLPLVWGNLFVLFISIACRLSPASLEAPLSRVGRLLQYLMVLVILAYAGALFRTIAIPFLIVATPVLASLILRWNSLRDLTIYYVAAILGSFGEILAMKSGLWIYTMPALRTPFIESLGIPGIPISLAMAWGLAAVLVNRAARSV